MGQFEKDNGLSSSKKITVKNTPQFEKDNDTSSKKNTVGQFEKDNGIIKEIKQLNKTIKQQHTSAVVVQAFEELKKIGFNNETAKEILQFHSEDKIDTIVSSQIKWLPFVMLSKIN